MRINLKEMDQDRAVQAMMLEIKVVIGEDCIPKIYDKNGKEVDLFLFISYFFKKYLHLMYVVGYDEGRKQLTAHNNHPIARVDKEGKVLEKFNNIVEAKHKYKCDHYTFLRSIQQSKATKKGLYWAYYEEESKPILT